MASHKQTVNERIAAVQKQLDWAIACHAEFVSQERQHRITRRRVEHRLRETNPKFPTAAIDLLLESDPEYLGAFVSWTSAQVSRKRADGEYEIAKMGAWAAIRALG